MKIFEGATAAELLAWRAWHARELAEWKDAKRCDSPPNGKEDPRMYDKRIWIHQFAIDQIDGLLMEMWERSDEYAELNASLPEHYREVI